MIGFRTQLRILLVLVLMLSALCVFCMGAQAESGVYRNVDWDLTDGVLTIGKAGQTQTFSNVTNQYYDGWPWYNNRSSIISARFVGNVVGQGSMNHMFYYCSSLTSLDVSNFDTLNVTNMSNMFYDCSSLTLLNLSNFDTSNVTDMHAMFEFCSKLTSLGLSNFNTSNVTDMAKMFYHCSSLTSLDLSGFNTSNVTDMCEMFWYCPNLTSLLGLSDFNTSKVTNMEDMFSSCSGLTVLDVSGFNTSKVTNMEDMFSGCSGLTSLDVSGFNTSSVTSMKNMFSGCSGLASLDVSSFNTLNVTNMYRMFGNCSRLTSLDVSGFNTSKVTNMEDVFYNCSGLTSLDLHSWDTSKVWNMDSMFVLCSSLTSLDLSDFNTLNVTNMEDMFNGCSGLTSLDLSSFNTSKVTNMSSMFHGCSKLEEVILGSNFSFDGKGSISGKAILPTGRWRNTSTGTIYTETELQNNYVGSTMYGIYVKQPVPCAKLYSNGDLVFYNNSDTTEFSRGTVVNTYTGWDTATYGSYSSVPWYSNRSSIKQIIVKDIVSPVSTAWWFYSCNNMTSVDFEKLNTSNVADMRFMFSSCFRLTSIDLSNFNTSNVTNMRYMFSACSGLTSLDLSGFDTSSVTDMYGMFNSCSGLTSLDVSGFNTSKVTWMSSMFSGCSSLTSLDISNFDTSKGTRMDYMFSSCSSLTSLDVSNFNTSNVTDMRSMFCWCSGLTSLDVSNFNTSKVTNTDSMFRECSKLTSLNISGFDTSNVTDMRMMFDGCSKLVSLDVSDFDTSKVTWMISVFSDCSSLTLLDLSSFDTSKATSMYLMFDGCSKLEEVILGSQFSFKGNGITNTSNMAVLPTPTGEKYTGKWIKENSVGNSYTPVELRDSYNGPTMSGTWVWEEAIMTLIFEKPVVDRDRYVGSMPSQTSNPLVDITLPINRFSRFGYVFDHWIDGNGYEYENKGVIPANRYSAGDTVTLTAVFRSLNCSVIAEDGQFEFELQGGITAEFAGVPGNTQYQIWEETPDGWQLVQEGNTSGIIPSERTVTVAYRNNYNPELAQVTLVGQKKVIDSSGIALYPAENQYTFTLTETTDDSSVLLQEIGNGDGGIVRFDPIELNSVGTHTYEIREVAGNNSHMDYDDHVETVTVQVTDNGSGLLTSEITTDSDGIVFTNYLNDRGSLKLTKIANDETGNIHWNEGETFSFDIMFRDKYDSVPSGVCSAYLGNEASAKGWMYDNATGVMTVVLSENKQSAVIENIPYGLQYSIQENLSDSGLYELTNVTGNTGVISETQSEAVFINTFKIVPTSIMLMAYKIADFDIEDDEFTFELLDSDMNVIQSVTNGSVVSDGMNSGKAPVLFDSIPVTSDGTFTYYIREVVGNDAGIEYDDQLIKCEVNVVNDHGYLCADVIYSLQD